MFGQKAMINQWMRDSAIYFWNAVHSLKSALEKTASQKERSLPVSQPQFLWAVLVLGSV